MKWEQLIRARESMHLSQLEAAQRADIALTTYQRWEQGKARPQPRNMRLLRETFGDLLSEGGAALDTCKDDASPHDETQDGVRESSPSTKYQARSKLAEVRAKKHWTLEEAAEAIGVSKGSLLNWEKGKTKPFAYNVELLCEAYRMTAQELGLYEEDETTTEGLGLEDVSSIVYPVAHPQREAVPHLQAFLMRDLTMHLQSLTSLPYRSYQDIHSAMTRILKDYDKMNTKNHHINRRKALLRLVTLPFVMPGIAAAFTSDETPSATLSKDLLAQCAVSIAACWELRKSTEYSDLALAFKGVSTYLPVLQRIVKDSSEYRQEAAGLVMQCLLLKSILGKHLKDAREAIQYAQQALFYSKAAKDFSLHLGTLAYLSLAYSYGKQHQQSLQTIEQAKPLLKRIEQKKIPISSHLQALVNGMLACVLTRNGQNADGYLDQASTLVSQTDNACPMYVVYEQGDFLLDAGIVYYQQGNSAKAIEVLSQLVDPKTFILKIPDAEITRIETINAMTTASLRAKDKDMEKTLHFWTAGIQGAKDLHSEQRFNEALTAYEIMQALWPDEKRIQDLRDLTEHW